MGELGAKRPVQHSVACELFTGGRVEVGLLGHERRFAVGIPDQHVAHRLLGGALDMEGTDRASPGRALPLNDR